MIRSVPNPGGGDVALFVAPDGQVCLDVRLERETVWLSLNQMAELFGRDKSVISRHVRSIFAAGELDREAVVAKNATTAADGKTYQVEYFDLDAAVAVGYFTIKDHPFTDGNKRVGSFLFLLYLDRNGLLIRPDGTTRFGAMIDELNETLAA